MPAVTALSSSNCSGHGSTKSQGLPHGNSFLHLLAGMLLQRETFPHLLLGQPELEFFGRQNKMLDSSLFFTSVQNSKLVP